MTDEEARAIAYQDQIARRRAYKAAQEARMYGSASAYLGLFNRTKALRGEVAKDDGRDEEDQEQRGVIGNL